MADYRKMWEELGMDVDLHDQLCAVLPQVLWYQLADSTFRIRASYPLWKSFPELFS